MKKAVILGFLIFLMVGAGAALFWSFGSGEVQAVRVATVEFSTLHNSVNTNGNVEADRVFELRAPFAGTVHGIVAREGDRLRAEQAILSVEDPSLQSELASARSELEGAELELRNIRRGPPPEEINQLDAEIARYRHDVESAQKALETNEWLLKRNAIPRVEGEQSRRDLARARQLLEAATTRKEDVAKRYSELDQSRAATRIEAARARLRYF